jgi:hypothetical protein
MEKGLHDLLEKTQPGTTLETLTSPDLQTKPLDGYDLVIYTGYCEEVSHACVVNVEECEKHGGYVITMDAKKPHQIWGTFGKSHPETAEQLEANKLTCGWSYFVPEVKKALGIIKKLKGE